MKLSIIIPVYNDRDYIERAIDQVRSVQFPIPFEIIAVDDGSVDGSREILQSIPNITVILHEHNTGKGGAIKTGLAAATGDIIAIQDDDCEYDPAILPRLIAPIIRGEADVVYGSRFLQKNQMFLIQRLENRAITWLANVLLGQRLTDIETGHKVFSQRVAKQLTLAAQGFEFDMEITLQITQLGYSIKELPTTYMARSKQQGKKITYKDGLRSIRILFKYAGRPFLSSGRFRRLLWATLLLLAIFIPRLTSLGQQLTIDEPLWEGRGQQFIKAFATGDFKRTLVGGQPGVTTAWLAGLAHHWQSLAVSQGAIALATGVLLLLISYFLAGLFGWRWGTLASFVLALDPFLLGHSRVVHTDALMALLALLSVLSLLLALAPLRQGKLYYRRYLIVSAAAASLAVLSKIFALFLVPLSLLIITVSFFRKRPASAGLRAVGVWFCVFVLAGYIAWPALWLHGDTVAAYLLERGALHTEGTRADEFTSQPWYYLRELGFRLSVPGSLLLPVGFVALLLTKRTSVGRWGAAWLLIGSIFLVVAMSFGADKSDRYVLFTLLCGQIVGIWGLKSLLEWLGPRHQKWAGVLPLACIIWLAADAARLHPYYLAHYNRLYPIEQDHKLGWGEGLEQAAAWIAQQNPEAKVISYYPRVISYFYPLAAENVTQLDGNNFDYLVLYRSMFERGNNSVESDILRQYLYNSSRRPVYTHTVNGLPYVWIYTP